LRILVAPDSFKGSLSAGQAAEAMRKGVLDALPDAQVECCALADGGEGTLDVVVDAAGGERRLAEVTGPLGAPVQAAWALLGDGATAVIEMAAAAGLLLVPEAERDPTRTTTYGVGELIRAALDARAVRVVVGVGGSATTDGGAGAAQALGVHFDGGFEPMQGGHLKQVRRVYVSTRDPRLDSTELLVACDVDNPLFGSEGAAVVYGPQKGASPDAIARLDLGLEHLARLAGGDPWAPGAGAAGGLAYGLATLCGARLVRGSDLVFDLMGIDERLARCDLVLTGEGRLDTQSVCGKVVGSLAGRAGHQGVPLAAIAGQLEADPSLLRAAGILHWVALVESNVTESQGMASAAEFVRRATAKLVDEIANA